jgi:UDP-2,4-diacetamido-2,4,6-trideoxy-beta-L-altropyranose hydrolase
MNIVIRADSSVLVGSGHIMRCLVLAKELRENHKVKFVMRALEGNSIDYVKAQGFDVVTLPKPEQDLLVKDSSDYKAWLQVSVELDAEQVINSFDDIDLLIVDHYALGYEWQKLVMSRKNCKIIAIDDLVRKHNADLILDQTLNRQSSEYLLANRNTAVLAGCDYALLNPMFIEKREEALSSEQNPDKHKILVFMGGANTNNLTLSVLKLFKQHSLTNASVTALVSNKSPSYESVKQFCSDNHDWVSHVDFVDDMADLMLAHTLMIGAPGTTSWERACLGIPSIIIPLADNQATNAKALVKAQAAILVDKESLESKLVSSCQVLMRNWKDYHLANLKLCDGLGVRRVVAHINNLVTDESRRLIIRKANTSDIQQVYEWQCHENTRKYALNPHIPTWEEHQRWMNDKLLSSFDYFYMIEVPDDEAVAVVRLDRKAPSEYVVSIFVSPDHYGKGIAKRALQLIDLIHQEITICATVLEDNSASQKLFTSAKYERVSSSEFVRPPLNRD